MAIRLVTKEYTFTGSGEIAIAALLGMPATTWIRGMAIRAERTNADDVFWVDAQGDKGGFLGPGEALTLDFGDGQSLAGNLTMTGSSGDKFYASLALNSVYFDSDDL